MSTSRRSPFRVPRGDPQRRSISRSISSCSRSFLIGLISILHAPHIDSVVLRMRPEPLDEHDLTFIVDGGDEAIAVSLDIEHHAFGVDDARTRIGTLQVS